MHNGYRGAIAATWLFILLATLPATKPQNHHPRPAATAQDGPSAGGPRMGKSLPTPLPPDQALDLYSKRALRRARTILQLKLLELREERLACAHEVLERHLPPDLLWDTEARKRYPGKKPACLNPSWGERRTERSLPAAPQG